jgi:hypothetical protein
MPRVRRNAPRQTPRCHVQLVAQSGGIRFRQPAVVFGAQRTSTLSANRRMGLPTWEVTGIFLGAGSGRSSSIFVELCPRGLADERPGCPCGAAHRRPLAQLEIRLLPPRFPGRTKGQRRWGRPNQVATSKNKSGAGEWDSNLRPQPLQGCASFARSYRDLPAWLGLPCVDYHDRASSQRRCSGRLFTSRGWPTPVATLVLPGAVVIAADVRGRPLLFTVAHSPKTPQKWLEKASSGCKTLKILALPRGSVFCRRGECVQLDMSLLEAILV